jgi:hypothetical protein
MNLFVSAILELIGLNKVRENILRRRQRKFSGEPKKPV